MDGLSAAASVLTVVELTAEVVALCLKYSTAVASARADIARLQRQIQSLNSILEHAHRLVESSNSQALVASQEAAKSLELCKDELKSLRVKLEPDPKRKAMQRFGLRALKWPFTSQEVEATLTRLEGYQHTISLGLQIDQMSLLLQINARMEHMTLQAVESPSTARKAHFVVPFPKDADFVNRPTLWERLMEQCEGPARRIALVGLGGTGKSQIAIQLAHHVHATSSDTSVFWIHGSSKPAFEESYRSLADRLALPRRHAADVNILALVRDWLLSEDASSWVMILDNADETDTFFPKNTKERNIQASIASYLPKTSNGRILVTSRSLDTAERLTGSHKTIIQIPTMGSSEALQLFRNNLQAGVLDDDATALVEALDFVPLAVNQAAAYINRRTPRVSVRSYLDDFRNSQKRKGSLLNGEFGDLRRNEGVSNSVVVTWQVTFEQIRAQRPSAANLLSLMSMFQAQNIPEYMLKGYRDNDAGNRAGNEDEGDTFEDDFDLLRGYSLIKPLTTAGYCEMHSLVQFCTQIWLSNSDDMARWKTLFLRLASTYFPEGFFENWATCQLLLPHIQSVLNEKPSDELDILTWCKILHNASRYMQALGDFSKAERILPRVVQERKRLLGDDHLETLESMSLLAHVHHSQGRFEEAEKLQLLIFQIGKIKFGADHDIVISNMGSLVIIYREQGRLEEAEKLQIQVTEADKARYGDDHPITLRSMGNLAAIYLSQDRLQEAEDLNAQVIEGHMIGHGFDGPETQSIMGNLLVMYMCQGRSQEAETLGLRLTEASKTRLGVDHYGTWYYICILAAVYRLQGRLEEAEKLLLPVLQSRKTKFGANHPDTLKVMYSLAQTFESQGRIKEAVGMMRDCVHRCKAFLEPEHPTTVSAEHWLGLWEGDQGRDGRFEE